MINVKDRGAVGDGAALDSPAIQSAIDAAAGRGGGCVHVPAGNYRCGTIVLRSYVRLLLDPGAVIRASHDLADYPREIRKLSGKDHHGRHLLVARDCEGIRIGGGGTIDGQGPAFWEPQPAPRAWIRPKPERVSPMLELDGCRDVVIEDLKLVESPGWTLHLRCCDRVRIAGLQIDNHRFGPNNDGIDLNGCRDVHISDTRIDTCDDAIVLKTTRDARSCERVTITGCILSSNCAAIKCGTESWHDFRQIAVSNCVATRSNRAFALYGFDGGTFEQISVQNIVCDTDLAFLFNHPVHLDARRRSPESRPSRMRDIAVRGLSARTDGRILMTAADGTEIEGITLDGVTMRYALFCDPAAVAEGTAGHQCSRHSPAARAARATVVAENITGLRVRGLRIVWPSGSSHPGWGGGLPRIENGGTRMLGKSDDGDDVPFAVLWARGCRGGSVELDGTTASDPAQPAADIEDCDGMEIR
jgi:hypothetical protein